MCKKLYYCGSRIDKCLIEVIEKIKEVFDFETLSSCCGHGKYPKTIVCRNRQGEIFEFFSLKSLKKTKRNRYYKKDEQDYYYLNPALIIE